MERWKSGIPVIVRYHLCVKISRYAVQKLHIWGSGHLPRGVAFDRFLALSGSPVGGWQVRDSVGMHLVSRLSLPPVVLEATLS